MYAIRSYYVPKLMDEPVERLAHLRLHNGTIWRWNRPLIAFDEAGQAQLRIEHRVVPAGPSVTDSIANAALFFGLIYQLAKTQQAAEQKLGFIRARSNFYAAARRGLDAEIFWFDWQRMPLAELVLGQLLPAAESGLAALGVEPAEIEHWLGIIRGRVETRQTGAAWQRAWVERHGHDMLALTQAYLEAQESGRPNFV